MFCPELFIKTADTFTPIQKYQLIIMISSNILNIHIFSWNPHFLDCDKYSRDMFRASCSIFVEDPPPHRHAPQMDRMAPELLCNTQISQK